MDLLKNQKAAEPIDAVYQDLETLLMQNIIRHCQDYGRPIATDEWLLKKLAEIGKLNRENIKIISRYAGLSQTAVERMLNEAAEEALEQVEPALSYLTRRGLGGEPVELTRSKRVKSAMNTLQDQAKDNMNLCNTTMMYKARDAYQKLVRDTASRASEIANKQEFLDALNKHASASVVGAESRQQAMRKCIQEFNDKGIPAFVDKAGREWTPEAYVNMVMRNTARNVTDEVQTARCLDHGVHLIEIDSHPGARPKCARDQGKIFDLDNGSGETEDARGRKIRYEPWNSSSYGEPDGILGINCGHHKFPFAPGVNIRSYFPTEDMDANDRLYRQTQIQRALERDVRKQKRLCMLYNESGDTEAFEKMAVKLKQKEANLKRYVDGNPELHRRRDREQVIGFDRCAGSKVVAADKTYAKKKEPGKITLKEWTPKAIEQRAKDEKIIKGLKKEKAVLYDASGNRIFQKAGQTHSVSFTQEEIVQMRGGVLTHNHPGGASFSPADINMLRQSGLREIRAVGRDGVYSMKQPKVWDKRILSLKEIQEQYDSLVEKHRVEMEQWAQDNLDHISVTDYQIRYQNKVIEDFAKNFGLEYRMEVLSDEET